jgi:hypothetical protein
MQEQQNEFPEESRHAFHRERPEREIFSFQEIPPPPPPEINRAFQYFIGLVIGCMPLALFFLSIGHIAGIAPASGALGAFAFYSYLALWPAAIVCLCISRVRFVGYGLLTMAIISPIIWTIACFATFRACYRGAC